MSTIFQRGPAKVQANLTPMIDVTFLLIVFFVLVSQIVEVENVPMDLPAPEQPASEIAGEEQRLVINVVPGTDGNVEAYQLGVSRFATGADGIKAMTAHLAELYAANPAMNVNLRADRGTDYQWVEPVMHAVSEAAAMSGRGDTAARVNLVVVREN